MHPSMKVRGMELNSIADPDPLGYYHAQSWQSGTFFGGLSDMTVYTPILENGEGHSIYQMWLIAGSPRQSVEVGWTVDPGLNGDLAPHLFTYFTTNDYTADGDNIGGYNRLQTGWVQSSATTFPGSSPATSSIDQQVNRYDMLFMLWQGNWWFKIENEWVGYYAASLFGTGAMASSASWLSFGGEVFSGLPNPQGRPAKWAAEERASTAAMGIRLGSGTFRQLPRSAQPAAQPLTSMAQPPPKTAPATTARCLPETRAVPAADPGSHRVDIVGTRAFSSCGLIKQQFAQCRFWRTSNIAIGSANRAAQLHATLFEFFKRRYHIPHPGSLRSAPRDIAQSDIPC
jgi:hypothetical protein